LVKKVQQIPLKTAKRAKQVLKYISRLNAFIYHISNGQLSNKWAGKYPIMILTVKGKKTGKKRHIPLIKVLKDNQPILVASLGGMPMNPDWFYSVSANPNVEIQIGASKAKYTARRLSKSEKVSVWPVVCSHYPDYQVYQDRTTRDIPVFLCEGKKITQDWKDWIELNRSRGCDRDELYAILLDEGFDTKEIGREMSRVIEVGFSESPKLFLPNAQKVDSDLVDELYTLPDFLNPTECDQMVEIIQSKSYPSTVVSDYGDKVDENYRTSSTCDLGVLDDPFVADIDRRICAIMGINSSYSEIIQGQIYEIGQEFKVHTDTFEGTAFEEHTKERGQRTYTFMIYLNDVEEGGETEFPELNLVLKPKKGMAVIWNDLNEDGSINYSTAHHAHPVKKGQKVVITKWFRSKGAGEAFTKEPGEYLSNYTKIGFKKDKLDAQLFKKIEAYYAANEKNKKSERVEGGYIETLDSKESGSDLIDLPDKLKKEIHKSLRTPLQKWSRCKLTPTFIYGIRVYKSGTALVPHRDRLTTHIVSAIINVGQNVEEEWPLVIEDNYYRNHHVLLKPGEVIYYESARLAHGRPQPLKGKFFANIFCHFMPKASKQITKHK